MNIQLAENLGEIWVSLDTIIGVAVGSGITLTGIYLTHLLTEKREEKKKEMEREKEAISQVFSPLVFILQKTGDLFVRIVALHDTLEKMSETEDKVSKNIVFTLNYLTVKGTESYPQALENLLIHCSGLIGNQQFYYDLVILQSYLSTIVDFLNALILRSNKNPLELKRYLSALGPIIVQLDEAIGEMRKYSIAKTSRMKKYEYKRYFTEQQYSELEHHINEANKLMTGLDVPIWPLPLIRLSEPEISKDANLKEGRKQVL